MLADDCETILRLLIEQGPQTMDQIMAATGWSMRTCNQVLCELLLNGQTRPVTTRVKGRKVIQYEYRMKEG
jgi:hypothetical protein